MPNKNEENIQKRKKSDEVFRNHSLGKTKDRILHGDSDQLPPLRPETKHTVLNRTLRKMSLTARMLKP